VVQDIGSWSEIPHDVVVHVPVDDDEAAGLADAFTCLATDPERGRRLSAAAARYATDELSPGAYCDAVVSAVEACRAHEARALPPRAPAPVASRNDHPSRAWQAVVDGIPAHPLRILAIDTPAWVLADLAWMGHDVTRPSRALDALEAGTFDLAIAPAPPPGPARRVLLASINRLLSAGGRVRLAVLDDHRDGDALGADMDASGLSVRSPRFDDPPTDLWPPPRGGAAPTPLDIVGRKAGLPHLA
jgi:hypothetical protein